jgi:uncharacterized protein
MPGQPGPEWWAYGQAPAEPAVVAAPGGLTYDQLARTARHRWWLPLAGTLAIVAAWFLVQIVVSVVAVVASVAFGLGEPPPKKLFKDPTLDLAASLVILACFIPITMMAARFVQRRPAGSTVSVTNRLRGRWLAICLGLAVVPIFFSYTITLLLEVFGGASSEKSGEAGWVGMSQFLLPAVVILIAVPFQAAGEEFVFRGWILQFFGSYLRKPYVGMAVQAVAFAMAHGLETVSGFVDLLLFATITGWLTLRTGGLEAGIALHTLNNLVAFLLAAATGQLADTDTAAQSPWHLFFIDCVVLTTFAVLVVLLARRLGVENRSRGPEEPSATTTDGPAPDAEPGQRPTA